MFSAREVATVLGLSASRLRSYLRSGFVSPERRGDGKLTFSFQDLVLLRKAEGLVSERIPPRRVRDAFRKLRERLPEGASLTGVRVAAEGREVVVDDGEIRWTPGSGQVVFDFDRAAKPNDANTGTTVTPLAPARAAAAAAKAKVEDGGLSARDLYERGCALEETTPDEASSYYRRALAKDPRLADAHVNLGRLLHESGEIHAALVHYRTALAERPNDATATFNLGVALEDLGLHAEAVDLYERAIKSEPTNADAHYNLARLLEQLGRPEIAIRHLLIYRQLTRRK